MIEVEADDFEEVDFYNGMADECSYSVIIEQVLWEYAGRDQDSLNDDVCGKEECGYSAAKAEQRPPERFD